MSHDPQRGAPTRHPRLTSHALARPLLITGVVVALIGLMGALIVTLGAGPHDPANPRPADAAGPAITGPIAPYADAAALRHPAYAARAVAEGSCRRIDPNLVRGYCLSYADGGGHSLTWIGSYRAPSGRVFFCIDYLYDSRLPGRARLVSTAGLRNQLGHRVGDPEVAALNALVGRWAPSGSTGSDSRDAAIALTVREVMGDGRRPGGLVVYPAGLRVGGRVAEPRGGVPATVIDQARSMWLEASVERGPYHLRLTPHTADDHGRLHLGQTRRYDVGVVSAAGRSLTGLPVSLTCTGPVHCPATLDSGAVLALRPRRTGHVSVRASVTGPAADGRLYVAPGWHGHGGASARDAGTQRGWIAQRNLTRARVGVSTVIVRAHPAVVTTTSATEAHPGASLTDTVTVSGLSHGYHHPVTAQLFGPFAQTPGAGACLPARLVGTVRMPLQADGTSHTPPVRVSAVGYYVWTESLPGDRWTTPTTTACGVATETTLVQRFTPTLATHVDHQRAQAGDRIHDTVVVAGSGGAAMPMTWVLMGPVRPGSDGTCTRPTRIWASAPTLARGALTVRGDGTHATSSTRLPTAGCYTYREALAATAVTEATESPAGQAAETALALRRHPRVHTTISEHRPRPGDVLRDTVHVTGLRPDDRVEVRWQLVGPVAPARDGRCTDAHWAGAPTLAHGTVVAHGSGRLQTRPVRVRVPGCLTYVTTAAASGTTYAVSEGPGLPSESALALRPPLPHVPSVPSGPSGYLDGRLHRDGAGADPFFYRAPATLDRPGGGHLSVPSLGITAPVDAVGLDHTTLAIPGDVHRVGWLRPTAGPGDVVGASVIAGHVSDEHDRPGALHALRRIHLGASVVWVDDSGRRWTYRVVAIHRYPRAHRLPASVFDASGPHVLRLVTCTDRQTYGPYFHYADNLVVTAVPVG